MSESAQGADGVKACEAPRWFYRIKRTTGEWGVWQETDAATVEDFRKNITLPIYEVRQFVPADGVKACDGRQG